MLRVEAMVLSHGGQWGEAEGAFTEAVSLARSTSNPYAEARALHEWGRMCLQTGVPQHAQKMLEEALAIFRRLGARPYIERAEQALAECG
jgi:uncharacterized protein HemY